MTPPNLTTLYQLTEVKSKWTCSQSTEKPCDYRGEVP